MANQSTSYQYITYGAKVNSGEVQRLLDHALGVMQQHPEERPTPICIWGTHGIGKTELVRDLAKERGYQFVYVAPAQFEEMGDLLGMPQIAQTTTKGEVTQFVAPEWVPQQPGPGILLLDDVNRADDRILRGIMQLLQNYETISWAMPQQWLLVLTANPDGGDYSVTTLDDAMLTRMLHITLEFEVKAWARWAEHAKVDERGIHFVLTYPELVTGRRTTPRSLVQFFSAIRSLDNLREHLPLLKLLGDACLDENTTQAFLSFIHFNLDRLPNPEEILDADDFGAVAQRLEKVTQDGDTKRLDVLSVITTRIINYVLQRKEELTAKEFENLKKFILLDLLPNDLRLAFARDLTQSKRPGLMRLFAVPEIGQLLLNRM